jgi:hypothetical protein
VRILIIEPGGDLGVSLFLPHILTRDRDTAQYSPALCCVKSSEMDQPLYGPAIYVPFPLLRAFVDPWSAVIADPEAFALGSAAAELSHAVVGGLIAAPAAVSLVAEPAFVSDAAAHQVCVGIPFPFDVSVPVSPVLTGADSAGHPMFLVFPSVDLYASSSSSVEVAWWESSHSSSGGRTNHGDCSILSSLGLNRNKNSEHGCSKPTHGRNNESDTNGLPMDATTTRSRKTNQRLYQEQRKRRSYQGALSPLEVPQM